MTKSLPLWVRRMAPGVGVGARHEPTRSRSPADSRSVLTHRTSVSEANVAGDVHGGWIMKLCDDVAVIAASRHAESRVVTLAVDGLLFRRRVKVGSLLILKATVNAAWRTSMEVGVRVEAEDLGRGQANSGQATHTLTAYVTMVALDGNGRPVPVPRLTPVTPEDERRVHEANLRRRIRLADPADMRRSLSGASDSSVHSEPGQPS